MARVELEIGGTRWPVACRDGEEAQLGRLGRMLDERWADAQRAAGDAGGARIMLLVALMLADDLVDAQNSAPAASDQALERLADRLESIADALEKDGPSA